MRSPNPIAATPLILALSLLLLGGCTGGNGRYPSLARRDIERVTEAPAPPPPATPLTPLSGDIRTRAVALAAEARAAHQRFAIQRPATAGLVGAAQGATVASENWSVATVALARLEASRSDAMVALAGLDKLYAEERLAGSDVTQLGELIAEVRGLVGEEDTAIAALAGQLAN